MVKKSAVLAALLVPLLTAPMAVHADPKVEKPSTVFGAEYLAPVTPSEFEGDLSRVERRPEWQPGDPIKEIPKRRKQPKVDVPALRAQSGVDPLAEQQRQSDRASQQRALATPALNFVGQGFTGVNPPDTVGDAGLKYYIQAVNSGGGTVVTIHNKADGSVTAGPFTLDTLGSGNCANGLGDPIVLYDELAYRWLISEFSASANRLCVYVSRNGNPVTGGWYSYEFTTPNFPDYPKYAIWPDAYYVTTNESKPAIYALERNAMLSGSAASLQRFTVTGLNGFGFEALTPADEDGAMPPPAGSPGYVMRHRDDEAHNPGSNDPTKDFLELWEVRIDWATPANSSITGPTQIDVTEFDSDLCGLFSFNCFGQPGSATTLDPLREVLMWRLQYRNFPSHESLVGNLVTDVDGTDLGGVRWFELRKSAPDDWSLYQEGTYSPDDVNRWMGSIAMDAEGNMALAYNVSDTTSVYPGLRYAGRQSGDPLGTLPDGEHTLINGTAANGSNRYGDYMATSVDPADDCTFWVTGEYNVASSWSTRIGSFAFDGCGYTPKRSCSGGRPVISSTTFNTDTDCVGYKTLTTSGAVNVIQGAHLNLVAPIITLGPQFFVRKGSSFNADTR